MRTIFVIKIDKLYNIALTFEAVLDKITLIVYTFKEERSGVFYISFCK